VKLVDWLQILSIAFVVVALILNFLQMRYVARQTSETARQAIAATTALRQAAYQNMISGQADYRSLYIDSPSMTRWHLESRGYETGSEEDNRRTLYTLVRLNSHESSFLAHEAGLLDDDVWHGWKNVIKTDFQVPKFVAVWSHAKQFYARSFAAFIENEIVTKGSIEADQQNHVEHHGPTAEEVPSS
jgi:hypothetical protein